ncbi:aminoacylase-1A-like [Adelges cooleyi]|uniref:aminoacylase-1A-like n=1 Tax=Adelges cooleyi TaxID=133065 RepID=UPI00217F5A0F|nr:aminoacylase-1A-like [Adelges cooleyi]
MALKNIESKAVDNFRKYLQIPTVHPNIDYEKCVQFLQVQAQELNLPSTVYFAASNKPLVIITWIGQNPQLQSLLLHSHMDVVPVYAEQWNYEPFSAHKDEVGNIYARGAQDMKCVGIQYLETIRLYLKENLTFDRTIHISFSPDEEIGGKLGMKHFVETDEFKALNVGFTLDEGMASPDDVFPVFNGEKTLWHFYIRSRGSPGHASLFHDNTAAEKLMYVVNKMMDWRAGEKAKVSAGVDVGRVTSINMTMLDGGCQFNVVPSELSAGFDIRISPELDERAVLDTLHRWCREAGDGVRVEFIEKNVQAKPTKLDDSNPWWVKFKTEFDKMDLKLKTSIAPGAGDSRYIRQIGIPALGFSPMANTPVLLHDHNEYLNENIFLKGIQIYYNIIKSLASV